MPITPPLPTTNRRGPTPVAGGSPPRFNRRLVTAATALFILATSGHAARAQSPGSLDGAFNPSLNFAVSSVVVQADGKVLLAGSSAVTRLNANGSRDGGFNAILDTFSTISDVVVQPDGKIILALDSSDSIFFRDGGVIRLNADGSPDSVFNDSATSPVSSAAVQADGKVLVGGRSAVTRLNANGSADGAFTTTTNGSVLSLAVQADGKIIVGGNFTQVNGATRNRLVRLDAAGRVDATFNASANGSVVVLAVQADGKVLAGGSGGITRFNVDGSRDGAFNPGVSGSISSVAVQADGKVIVGGTDVDVARLNADGSVDITFRTTISPRGSNVSSVAVQADGKIIVGGGFTQVNGTVRANVARVFGGSGAPAAPAPVITSATAATGQVRQAFTYQIVATNSPTGYGGTGLPAGLDVNPTTGLISGTPTAAGTFRVILGATNATGTGTSILTLTVNGFRVPAPGSIFTTFDPGVGADSTVRAIAYQPDGKALIGGAFTSYRGVARPGVARVNPDGSLDLTFNPGGGADDTVNALLRLPNGQVLVGGDFSAFNGVTRNGVVRLNPDGSVDPAFDVGLEAGGRRVVPAADGGAHPWAPDPVPRRMAHAKGTNQPGYVSGLAIDANGKIILAGLFQRIRGQDAPSVARVEAAGGAPDPEFKSAAGAPDGQVRAVSVQKDGKILVAGLFDRTGSVNRKNIARLNADGSPDTSFDPGAGAQGGAVNAVLVQDDGGIVLGGEFLRAGGQPFARVARVYPDGSVDAGFDPGAGADGAVRALAPAPNGGVLVGGDFKNLNAVLSASFSRIRADGKPDTGFNVSGGANGTVAALAIAPDNAAALVGGDFSRVSNSDRNRLALVDNSVSPAPGVSVVGAPGGGGFLVTRTAPLNAVTVFYHNGGSASRGKDYVAFPGSLTFAANQTDAIIPVTLLSGANRDKKVKVFLDPSPNGAYTIGKAQSKVFLSDLP